MITIRFMISCSIKNSHFPKNMNHKNYIMPWTKLKKINNFKNVSLFTKNCTIKIPFLEPSKKKIDFVWKWNHSFFFFCRANFLKKYYKKRGIRKSPRIEYIKKRNRSLKATLSKQQDLEMQIQAQQKLRPKLPNTWRGRA